MSTLITPSAPRAYSLGFPTPSGLGNLANPAAPAVSERVKLAPASTPGAAATTPTVQAGGISPALAPLADLAAAIAATRSVSSLILNQPGAALLAQSRLSPQSVLTLLQ